MKTSKPDKNKTWSFKININHPLENVFNYVGTVMVVESVSVTQNDVGTYEYEIVIGRASDHGLNNGLYKEIIDTPAKKKPSSAKKKNPMTKSAKKKKRTKPYIQLASGRWYTR